MPTLNWIGKEKVVTHADHVPYRVLDHKYDYGEPTDGPAASESEGNMIIHGDNLEALKALLPKYENNVDCIYIDPPYNTGNEGWVYNDNVNDPHIRKWLGEVVGKEAEDLTRHDKWLCMMYPRLVLLQKLLSPTGAIFISIDDNEQANLKLICDEIFGAGNFVAQFIWKKRKTQANLTKYVANGHEYILLYAQNKNVLQVNKLQLREEYIKKMYKNPDNDPRGLWMTKPLASPDNAPNKKFELDLRNGRKLTAKWRVSQESYDAWFKDNLIVIPNDGQGMPRAKVFLNENEGQIPNTLLIDIATTEDGSKEIEMLFGSNSVFTYPKPSALLQFILPIIANKDTLILDSFAGSGTTAHAVLNLNKQDGGHRRFILVEMCDYAETITAERVRRVIRGYGEGSKAVEGTGGTFSYYELGETLFDPKTDLLNDHADTEHIREYVWYSETHTPYRRPDATAHPYLLGRHDRTNYYFYYLPAQETCLDWDFLNTLTEQDRAEMYIIYADRCLLSEKEMAQNNIRYKKIPRDIKRV